MTKQTGMMFQGPLVRAILEGRKTQTRRIVKWKSVDKGLNLCFSGLRAVKAGNDWVLESDTRTSAGWRCRPTTSPAGNIGDLIYVRETWMDLHGTGVEHRPNPEEPLQRYAYGADCPAGSHSDSVRKDYGLKWKPSIHMPKSAARIWLEITGVRVERLQDISRGDAMAEGCPFSNMAKGPDPREWFAEVWNATGGAWSFNPWVWVYEFKRVDKPQS